jgi:hypothetical protein
VPRRANRGDEESSPPSHLLATCFGPGRRARGATSRAERPARQLLRAVQALATVRRLIAPTQVNIGRNQINVVG